MPAPAEMLTMKATLKRNFIATYIVGYLLAAAALFGSIALVTQLAGLDQPASAHHEQPSDQPAQDS